MTGYPVLQSYENDKTKIIFAINQLAKGLTSLTGGTTGTGIPLGGSVGGTLAIGTCHSTDGQNYPATFTPPFTLSTLQDGLIAIVSVDLGSPANHQPSGDVFMVPDGLAVGGSNPFIVLKYDYRSLTAGDISSYGHELMLRLRAPGPFASNWYWQLLNPTDYRFRVYHASGATDTAGLNNAIASLGANGGTVWLPDPLYQFATGPINIPRGVFLIGMGAGTVSGGAVAGLVESCGTELRATVSGTITSLILFTDAPGSGLGNLQITAASGATITNAIAFAGSSKNFTQCYFRRVSIQGNSTVTPGNISVGFAFGTNTVSQPVQFVIEDCIVNNCTNGITGTNTGGAGGITMLNTTIGGGTNGINTVGMAWTLINCYFQSQSNIGVSAVGKTVPGLDMGFPFFAFNTLVDSSGTDGWQLTNWPNLEISGGLNSSACGSGHVSGNGMTLTSVSNFKISAHVEVCFAHGIRLVTCSKGTINGCVINNNAGGTTGANGTGDAISMSGCDNISVTGCTATNSAPGTTITGNQGYGLTCDATTTNILVSNCDFAGNAGTNQGQYKVTVGAAAIRITHRGTPFQAADLAAVVPPANCPSSSFNCINSNTVVFGATFAAGAPNSTVLVWSNGTNYTIIGA